MPDSFAEMAMQLGVELDDSQVGAFALYRDLIIEAAGQFNLTAVRGTSQIERRHFLEALALGRELDRLGVLPQTGDCRAIDIGAGAGIPGIPLRIAWPRLRLSLLESNEKRCRFLRRVIGELGLTETIVLEGRAESWGRDPAHRDGYDLALARAVAPLPVLLEYGLPFLRPGGVLAAPKGSGANRELAASGPALRELGGEVEAIRPFESPDGPGQNLIIVRKLGATPARYPRRTGIPSKRPLA